MNEKKIIKLKKIKQAYVLFTFLLSLPKCRCLRGKFQSVGIVWILVIHRHIGVSRKADKLMHKREFHITNYNSSDY